MERKSKGSGRWQILALAAALLASGAQTATSAATPEEAAKLGTELTPFGAIAAGNADGSIPAYTGGLQAPANYVPTRGHYPDPYADDKPLFRITAANVDQYADRLSAGQVYQLKTVSDYYIDIYPSHRSTRYPDAILAATVRNATGCSTERDGLALSQACRGGIPFPLPKTGNELMWNKLAAYIPPNRGIGRQYMVDANGSPVMAAELDAYIEKAFYVTERESDLMAQTWGRVINPPRKAGEASGRADFLDPIGRARRAWSYSPGQRRVRMAPEFAYDTPISITGGVLLYDEINLFDGAMDRFDFKLVGKKEMFINYNNFKMWDISSKCTQGGEMAPKTISPDCERFELHRVWVVEATLKPGKRHVYSRRIFYFDEDNFTAGASDSYDQAGQLYRTANQYTMPWYEQGGVANNRFAVFDLIKGMYTIQGQPVNGHLIVAPMPAREVAPEAVAAAGAR